jgi:hypothetical protein
LREFRRYRRLRWTAARSERVFGLRRRRAIDLKHQLGSYRSGKGRILDRMMLLRLLEGIQHSPESDEHRIALSAARS